MSVRSHIFYVTSGRKAAEAREHWAVATSGQHELPGTIPQYFSAANLIHRQSLHREQTRATALRYQAVPGCTTSLDMSGESARIMQRVGEKRKIEEIGRLAQRAPEDDILRASAHFFEQGFLSWRGR